MTESPIPQQTHKPNPAPANPNPNPHHPTQNPNVGKIIQGKCHGLEKTQTSKQLLTRNLDKMLELRGRKVVPKGFQINIKLTFPGTNPTREQIEAWWAAEKTQDSPCSRLPSKQTVNSSRQWIRTRPASTQEFPRNLRTLHCPTQTGNYGHSLSKKLKRALRPPPHKM